MKREEESKFDLSVSETGTAAYLKLPTYPTDTGAWKVSRTVELIHLIPGYEGPEVILDFGPSGELIGIEILVDDEDDNN